MLNQNEQNKVRELYNNMLEAAKNGRDSQAYEFANEIWNNWYFKLFNDESRSNVEHILTHYFSETSDKAAIQ